MTASSRKPVSGRLIAWMLASAALLIVAGANVHLVYVATQSQPDCVPHVKGPGEGGNYSAANSAC